MPTAPEGLTVEEQMAWQERELRPWWEAQQRRESARVHDGRVTGRDRQRAERQQWFAEQVAAIDRRTLIASLYEVDPAELLA
jgi:hypothetical protein